MKRIVVATLSAVLVLSTLVAQQAPAAAADNPVVVENQQAGSTGWQINPRMIADDATGQIKGYASLTSVSPGQSITFYVTVNPAQTYSIDVYRIGWYSGMGGRLRLHVSGQNGIQQSACTPNATTGLIACGWTPSYTFTVPADWTSGIYYTLLTNAAGYQNSIIFAVKDGRPAAFVYQQAVNTYQAYNNYPDDHVNGKSLYSFNSYGANTISGTTRAVKVSFDRPYSGEGSMYFFTFEINLVRWLEKNGYDVTYTTDVDTDANDGSLASHKGFLSAGHDEYWSKGMYDAALAARNAGVNLAFFGANAVYWQARYEASAGGAAKRILVCYKDPSTDPVRDATTTVQFRDPLVNRPEQTLMGVMFRDEVPFSAPDPVTGNYVPNNSPYVVTNSSHWLYAGTGFKDGDSVPKLVGYEMDRYDSSFPGPTGATQWTFLSNSPYTGEFYGAEYAQSSIYQAPSGAWVFASGTMSWSWGLDNYWYTYADPRIQRATANLLNAFLNGAPKTVHDLKVTAPANAAVGQAFTVGVTAEDASGSPVTTYTGTVHFATSDTGSGVVLPADSTLTNGQGSFSVTLATTGPQTITVSDAANSFSTTASVTVAAAVGPANHLVLATTATPTAGAAFSFTVTAQDSAGNTDTGYAGTVHFTSTDTSTGTVLPANATLTNGQGTFSATLFVAGAQTITATDTATASITGALNVSVRPAAASKLALTTGGAYPTAGTPLSFTATALDQYGNTDTAYAGTVHFTSSDTSTGVALPADATLTNGQGTFSATLIRAGVQTITATDNATASITGVLTVTVRAASATKFAASASTTTPTAGAAFSVTLKAQDQYGNTDTAYAGRAHFTSSDTSSGVVLPADSSLTNGQGTFSVTLTKAGAQTVTATDTATASITGSVSVTVKPGAAASLTLGAPATATANQSFYVTVTAKDRYGNVATGYRGTVQFTSSDLLATLPANYTFTAGDAGAHSFSVTLVTPPSESVTVTDTANASLTASAQITVKLPLLP